jgi:hypothetical protein
MKLSAPKSSPRRGSQSIAELRALQKTALDAIRLPLTRDGRTQSRWTDGRPMQDMVCEFIKPNDRLTSVERLEIYNKQYWYRLMDCLWDDYPGLRTILGLRKFEKLRIAYLNRYPSRSYTLRNLGSRLVEFIEEQPELVLPQFAMCLDMARFEWAQVLAFDSEARPPLTVDDLLGKDPAKLRVSLQPYISLLELGYPLDDFVMTVKKRDKAMRNEASNAVEANRQTERQSRIRLPRAQTVYLSVHRHHDDLYYKRLEPQAFAILTQLRDGATVAQAAAAALSDDAADQQVDWAGRIREWFSQWMELGWMCKRGAAAR